MAAVSGDASLFIMSGRLPNTGGSGPREVPRCQRGALAAGCVLTSPALVRAELAGGPNKSVRTDLVRLSNLFLKY